jgi:hypothetical protein
MKYSLSVSGHPVEVEAKNLNSAVHKASKELIKEGKIEKKPKYSDSSGEWVGVTVENEIKYSPASAPISFDASAFRVGPEKEAQEHNDWVRHEAEPEEQRSYMVVTPRKPLPKPEAVGAMPPLKWRKKYLARKKAAK